MARKVGAMVYPSIDLLFLLCRVYRGFTKECSKSPAAQIDITSLQHHIAKSSYLHNYENSLHRTLGGRFDETKFILDYITGLFVRACGHSFAKKLFQNLRDEKAQLKAHRELMATCKGNHPQPKFPNNYWCILKDSCYFIQLLL